MEKIAHENDESWEQDGDEKDTGADDTYLAILSKQGLYTKHQQHFEMNNLLNIELKNWELCMLQKFMYLILNYWKKDERNQEKGEKMLDREGSRLEASLPSTSAFPDGDYYFSVMMDSFDLFLKNFYRNVWIMKILMPTSSSMLTTWCKRESSSFRIMN